MSALLFLVLLVGCCGYAFWRGGAPERIAAGLQATAFAVGITVHRLTETGRYATVLPGTMIVDLVLLAALATLAHRSTRFWPLWLGGFQFAAVVAHVTKAIDPGMLPLGYAFQTALWGYVMLLGMAIGTLRHQRRLAAGDPDTPWKSMLA